MLPRTVLVAYATSAGSTQEVAEAIAQALRPTGCQAEVRRVEEVADLDGYTAVIVGGPMILGWHRAARRFLTRHRRALARVPVACFCTAMSLTQPEGDSWEGIPLTIDPRLATACRDPSRPSFRERYASVANYLKPIRRSGGLRPASVAFFGGKLDLMHLGLPKQLFVMAVVRARPGDLRNWPLIREWATQLGSAWAGPPES
jgi:menaquinone-dependent protoporphyrinogen oxidase